MQHSEEDKSSKVRSPRPKSQTRFPKKYPSYVVAFSLKETYDDLVTAQQMICNKKSPPERSPQESTNSITPTNSLKMFDAEQSDKLCQNFDKRETKDNVKKNSPHDSINSMESMTPTNSFKYLNGDNISDVSLITIGEKENIVIDLSGVILENSSSENEVRLQSDQISQNAAEIENETISQDKQTCDSVDLSIKENIHNILSYEEEQTDKIPETESCLAAENKKEGVTKKIESVMEFKTNRKYKKKRTPKRQFKKAINIKQKNFKYKNPKKNIDTQLEKYYEKRNSIDADQIQKELYSNEVSTVVSRTSVLHKIVTKENLLEQTELNSFIHDVGLNEYGNESLPSSMLTTKKSITSNSSQNTIKQKASTTSVRNENEINDETENSSIIKVHTENTPYKTDVINVAVAVAYNRSKVNTRDDTAPVSSNEKFMHLGSLTSSETVPPFISKLTSESPTNIEDFKAVTIETSDGTLVNKNSSFDISSDDFVIARTSSDFSKSCDDSTYTLKNNIETVVDIEPTIINPQPNLMETVINLGIYPEMTPSTSSDTPFEYDFSDVIVSKNPNNKYPINSSKGDNKEQNIPKNILKKSTNQQKEKVLNRIINLPNQAEIKALLKANEMPQMKCAEESRHPSYLPEIWDRLVMTLDLAVKRLEDSLIEKITKELKNTLNSYPIPKDIPIPETNDDKQISKEVVEETKRDANQCLQCDLVKNKIIDQIVQKLSSSGPKVFEPGVAIKSLPKPKLFEDFEVLKSPELRMEVEKGETATVSTVTYEVCKFRRLKTLFAGPYTFVRENVFVITSVPTFFVVLLCVYGFILLSMKTW